MVVIWFRVCLCVFALCGVASAQDGYVLPPYYDPSQQEISEGPETPVPPVPTPDEQFEAMESAVRMKTAEISTMSTNIKVFRYLLAMTQPGATYDSIAASIAAAEIRIAKLRTERRALLQQMMNLGV